MEYLTEDHLKHLLSKEWLVKNDNVKSVPYLFKYYASAVDQSVYILITDTKQVWGEALSSKGLPRRWRDCNPQKSSPLSSSEEVEDEWRSQILDLVSAAHTLGGTVDLSFEVIESRNADLAVELGSDEFKWKWETYSLGPKVSAEVLSQHLIMPLISMTHLAFSSADPVSELSEPDLEKAVDKVARAARRSVDTHVKHALTKPRVATGLSRMSAIFNFIPVLPAIFTEASTSELKIPAVRRSIPAAENRPYSAADSSHDVQGGNTVTVSDNEPPVKLVEQPQEVPSIHSPKKANDDDSATEAESDEEEVPQRSAKLQSKGPSSPSPEVPAGSANRSQQPSPKSSQKQAAQPAMDESSDTSPARPNKKPKRVESSSDEEDSEAERRRRLAQRKNASTSRGTKQPIKRGARRF